MIHNIRQYQVPLQKYMAMMDLQVYLIDDLKKLSIINHFLSFSLNCITSYCDI